MKTSTNSNSNIGWGSSHGQPSNWGPIHSGSRPTNSTTTSNTRPGKYSNTRPTTNTQTPKIPFNPKKNIGSDQESSSQVPYGQSPRGTKRINQWTKKGTLQAQLYKVFKSLDSITEDQFVTLDTYSIPTELDKFYNSIQQTHYRSTPIKQYDQADRTVEEIKRVIHTTGTTDLSRTRIVSILINTPPSTQLQAIAQLRQTTIPQEFLNEVETTLFDRQFD